MSSEYEGDLRKIAPRIELLRSWPLFPLGSGCDPGLGGKKTTADASSWRNCAKLSQMVVHGAENALLGQVLDLVLN